MSNYQEAFPEIPLPVLPIRMVDERGPHLGFFFLWLDGNIENILTIEFSEKIGYLLKLWEILYCDVSLHRAEARRKRLTKSRSGLLSDRL
jgi:hypothetical protein